MLHVALICHEQPHLGSPPTAFHPLAQDMYLSSAVLNLDLYVMGLCLDSLTVCCLESFGSLTSLELLLCRYCVLCKDTSSFLAQQPSFAAPY